MDDQNILLWLETVRQELNRENVPVALSMVKELQSKLEMKGTGKIMSHQEQIDNLRDDMEKIKEKIKL